MMKVRSTDDLESGSNDEEMEGGRRLESEPRQDNLDAELWKGNSVGLQ